MYRPVSALAAAAVGLTCALGAARADSPLVEPVADQEMGGTLGLRMGGGTTPGGLALAGRYLYRGTAAFWSETTVGFSVGSGQAACFRDREDNVICDHSLLDGLAAGVASGLRWMAPVNRGFVPYARATLGLELVHFTGDDVRGVSLPLELGAGVRARVADRVAVSGGADLHLGVARLGRDIGGEAQVALLVQVGVDFAL